MASLAVLLTACGAEPAAPRCPEPDASTDPLIDLARRVDPYARAVRRAYEDKVEAVEKKNGELIARARFAAPRKIAGLVAILQMKPRRVGQPFRRCCPRPAP